VLSDVLARYKRLRGFHVLHPMGWDAFGLPAENDAIKKKTHPRVNTQANVDNMRRQLKELGAMYDWSRELATTDPAYYRWTQWIFLRMYRRGLAYKASVPINWCPNCRAGLANEEVVAGRCERCNAEVERQDRKQWLMRITRYADRLLADLDPLDWPEKVKTMQRNWIGRSEGAEVTFTLHGPDGTDHPLVVFTTRPDTLYGATYVVLAPEHPLALATATPAQRRAVEAYAGAARKVKDIDRAAADRQKTGVATGATATNPATGAQVPVWVSDYVLMTYGTGAIMAVPAHDERDFAFARTFHLPIVEVIRVPDAPRDATGALTAATVGEGPMVNSGPFDGTPSAEGKRRVTEALAAKGVAKPTVQYRLRDWVFSRQRYWGEPIPIVHCAACGEVPVPDDQLPVLLPEVQNYEVSGTGESPLATIAAFADTTCPTCAGPARRETDTMPQWAGSCWYFLRYASPAFDRGPFDPAAVREWLPVDQYVGGIEHAILHLLYARFFVKVLFDEGLLPFHEPFVRLFNQGMICRRSYWCDTDRTYLREADVLPGDRCPTCQNLLHVEMEKMGKSKRNDVTPDELVGRHGTDAIRLYELSVGPPEADSEWATNGIAGCTRFLKRLFAWVHRHAPGAADEPREVARARHVLVKGVTERVEALRFNTAISTFMEFMNAVEDGGAPTAATLQAAVVCVAPFAPHLAEELWQGPLARRGTVFDAGWPAWDAAMTKTDAIEVPVQVNGKLRATVTVPAGIDDGALRATALAHEKVQAHTAGKTVKKVIVVPGRLVNVVVG
jgi:leucyl-tRNA synthetase